MMVIENRCCDCAAPGYPCRGSRCPNRHVEVHYCDNCDEEIDTEFDDGYEVDGKELCRDCRDENDDEED